MLFNYDSFFVFYCLYFHLLRKLFFFILVLCQDQKEEKGPSFLEGRIFSLRKAPYFFQTVSSSVGDFSGSFPPCAAQLPFERTNRRNTKRTPKPTRQCLAGGTIHRNRNPLSARKQRNPLHCVSSRGWRLERDENRVLLLL